ncbi:MAG: DIP1984 family protein [Oscillospiraceae bacterium]|nr:DIP1984 family protein [Oscillospiraceae bacterium]
MKLAEALQERADLNRRISELTDRISCCVLVQEGEEPPEDPEELFHELDADIAQLGQLIASINRTNSATVVDGKSLTEIIAEKDALNCQLDSYRSILSTASADVYRARETEIKILKTVDVRSLRRKTDAISKQIRLLDNTLQRANWTYDLMEE